MYYLTFEGTPLHYSVKSVHEYLITSSSLFFFDSAIPRPTPTPIPIITKTTTTIIQIFCFLENFPLVSCSCATVIEFFTVLGL